MTQLFQRILTFAIRGGLDSPEKVKLISKGITTETYQLQDSTKKYIVVLFRRKECNFHPFLATKATKHFSEMGFPVPKIISTGKIEAYDAILTEFSQGKVKPHWEICDYESLGFLIGNLHLSQKQLLIPEPAETIIQDMQRRLTNLKDAIPDVFKGIFAEVDNLAKLWPDHLPKGLIHGDIWYKNVLFEDGQISALLDFSFPYYDCLIYDLATIMKGIYFSNNATIEDEKFNAFLEQYQIANPLSNEEIEALPLMLKAKIIYTIIFMLEQANSNAPQRENFLSTAMFNLLKLNETHEISFEKILL